MRLASCIFVTVLSFAAIAAALGNPGRDPRDILRDANAAAARLKAIAYRAEFRSEMPVAVQSIDFSGTVVARRGDDDQPPRVLVDGTVTNPMTRAATPFQFAIDGRNVYSVEHAAKIFASGTIEEAGPTVGNPLFPGDYLSQAPFDDELRASRIEYGGEQDIKGVRCETVKVKMSGMPEIERTLSFGREDHLLRRAETVVTPPQMPGRPSMVRRMTFTAENLDANPSFEDDVFHLKQPDGYTPRSLSDLQRSDDTGLLAVGSPAPSWELKARDGSTVSLEKLRGKVVVLDFWASWCGPCKMAMPSFQRLHERYKEKSVAIYGVNCREKRQDIDPFQYIKSQGFTYGQLVGGDDVAQAYRVGGIPCYYVIGPDGKIAHAGAGFDPNLDRTLGAIIERLLKQT